MYKFIAIVIFAIIACVAGKAKPGIVAAPLAYSTPLVASVPASAIISREYHGNGFASPYVAAAAPYVAASPYASPYVAAPYASPYAVSPYAQAYSAYSAPLLASPAAAYPYAAGPVLL